jgi:uncharacterized protein YodC (DUF2158 family)
MPESFNVGDIVQLKSGGPKMTVNVLMKVGGFHGGEYLCQWFGGKKLEQGYFPSDSLKKADENAE